MKARHPAGTGLRRLAAAAAVGLLGSGCGHPGPPRPGGVALAAPAPWTTSFRDIAAEAGIGFRLGHGGKTPLSILETAGGGGALFDYDGDGRLDVLLAGPHRCALYRNLGRRRFEDVTRAAGLDLPGYWMGCAVGDYDNDGRPDVYLTGYRRSALLHNEEGRRFRDVTAEAGVGLRLWTTSAAFADFDGDGWLDLYVCAYLNYRLGTKDLCRMGSIQSACGPEHYDPERGTLFRNEGNGHFRDVTASAGVGQTWGKAWGVAVADYDGDGRPDFYVANDMLPGNLYRNRTRRGGPLRFEDAGLASGTAYDAVGNRQGAMGVDWGDFNRDGRPDLMVTTYYNQSKSLYLNEGGGLFREIGEDAGLALPTQPNVAFGCSFFDADNNGELDLLIVNGHVRDNIHGFDASQEYRQRMQMFANTGGGRFTDVSRAAGASFAVPMVARGTATGDIDEDGDVDVLVVDLEGPVRLLENQLHPAGNWIGIRLSQPVSNREAIGARVTVVAGKRRWSQEVTRARSIHSASDARLHFGLGDVTRLDRVEIRWPGGSTTTIPSPELNRTHVVQAGSLNKNSTSENKRP